jgi:protease secretion system outer membrane protein
MTLVFADVNLLGMYQLAKIHDPKFRSAEADKKLNKFQSTLAYSAYAPSFNMSLQDSFTNGANILNSISITQPIIDFSKIDQLRQGAPRDTFADAIFMTQEQDLVSRIYSAVANLISQNQAIKSNNVRINTLQKQLDRIARLIELGFGTITDERDIKVRFEQAVANGVNLEINRRNAVIQIMALTNNSIDAQSFDLPEDHQLNGEFEINSLLVKVLEKNPNLIAARSTEEIAVLEAKRLRDQILPTISVSQTKRWGTIFNDEITMLNFSMPLDATRVIGGLSSSANEEKAVEQRRQVEVQTKMLTNQLFESVVLGREALKNKKNAVEAAKLSVEANEKSSIAGVRTTIEVLNSIDTLYQNRNEYASVAVALGNSLLNLLLISGVPPDESIIQTQKFLFGNRS